MSNDVPVEGPIPALDFGQELDLSPEDIESVLSIVTDLTTRAGIEIRAAHAYDRQGYVALDSFSGPQNPSYRRDDDDIVIQVSLVVRSGYGETFETMQGIYHRVQEADRLAEIAKREAEVAQAEQDLAAAQERLDALRAGSGS